MTLSFFGCSSSSSKNYPIVVRGSAGLKKNTSAQKIIAKLEIDISDSLKSSVFMDNNALAWSQVKNMQTVYLTNQWREGNLFGTKPADAFDIQVGLGSTMTSEDIIDGIMRVTVKVAVTAPGEFTILTFAQEMPRPQ